MSVFDLFRKEAGPRVGAIVRFGRFCHETDEDIRPIEWIVLESGSRDMLLLSRYCLDTQLYAGPDPKPEDGVWERCRLRKWLNEDFAHRAFSDEERARLLEQKIVTAEDTDPASHKNKVFLLSKEQVEGLLAEEKLRLGYATPCALERGAFQDPDNGATMWWILPHKAQWESFHYPQLVNHRGECVYHSRLFFSTGAHSTTVRPAIRIRK